MNGEIWNWKDVAKKDGNGREKKEGKSKNGDEKGIALGI